MKVFKYLVALVAGMMAFTACEKDPADLYGVEATAPVMDSHADILLTENSTTETVTFSWKAARGMGEDVLYTLYATLDGQETTLATTNATFFTADKEALRDLLLTGFNLPGNDNFSIGMYVAADNGLTVMKSEAITMNVYVYGDYVPAIVSVSEEAAEGVVLTEAMTENIELINWTAARFEYGTNPLYKVEISYNDGERQVLAEGIATTSYAVSPSTLNSTLIALGCPKDAASDVKLIVTSYLEGEGAAQLESEAVTVTITTYTPSYPEFVQLCGDFGGHAWNTESALPILKGDANTGEYHGLVSYYGAEYGMKIIYTHPKTEATVWVGAKTEDGINYMVGVDDNITPEEGSYVVYVNLSKGTMTLGKIESIGLIGSATEKGWDGQTNFVYNPDTGAMELKGITLGEGAYKVRVNDNWGNPWEDPYAYNLGGDPNDMTFGGSDIPSEPGVYDITMNLSTSANYALTFAKTGDVVIEDPMDAEYSIIGSFPSNEWASDYAEFEKSDAYFVAKNVTIPEGASFKIRKNHDWAVSYGMPEGVSAVTIGEKVTLTSENGANIVLSAGGAFDLYFYPKSGEVIVVNAGEELPTPTAAYAVIGAFNGWDLATQVPMEAANNGYVVAKNLNITGIDIPNNGFKVKENVSNWDNSWGSASVLELGAPTAVYHNGGNMGLAAEGAYDVYFNPDKLLVIVVAAGADDPTGAEPVEPSEPIYSVAGTFNGWGNTDMEVANNGYYVAKNITFEANGEFKFKPQTSWDPSWGNDGSAIAIGEVVTLTVGGSNIKIAEAGSYDLYFNPTTVAAIVVPAGTADPTGGVTPAAHTYSLVGSFNGWNQTDTTYTMTASAADTYTFSNIALAAYDEFKIVEDYAWTVSYGAAATVALDQKFALTSNNGGNIVMPATGTFNITFYAATSELLIEAVGQVTYPTPGGEDISIGLVGDMTGWSATGDILFTKQAGGVYTIESVALTAAQGFKVRKTPTAEKEWDDRYNWGLAASGALTTGVDNDLICGGGAGNMYVAEDGNYKVTFTPATDDKGVIPSQPAKIKVEKIASEPETPSTPAQTLEWSSSLFEQFYNSLGGDNYTEDVDLGNGLKFIAGGSKCKFGSNSGAYRIQLGSSGNTTKCTLQLDVTGPGTLEVDIQSSGDAARYLAVAVDGTEVTPAEGLEAPDKSSARQVYKVDCSSAKAGSVINMYSKGSAINVFVVKWTPAQ